MDYVKYILVLVVLFVDSDADGHEESHDHVKVHVPEFFHHDHHTKVITIHHHHHKPKKEHHHHHHHHHKPIIPHGPPKFHHTHHHAKSSSHIVSKGHSSVGNKIHGNHGHHGKQGHHGKHGHSGHHSHSGHDGHHSYKHHDVPSYDPPPINYDPPTVNYAPPSINYSPTPSFGSDHSSFLPSVPNIPSPQLHGVVHTVQQVKVFDSLPGALNTGSTGYQVTEQGDESEEDVFSSVNSLSESYPGTFGHLKNAAEQSDSFSNTGITHSNYNQSPNTDPFSNAQPQTSYANLEDFTIQSQSAQSIPNVQPSYSGVTGYDNSDNSVLGNDLGGASVLSFAEADQDDTPVSFSREAGLQRAINTGGIETVAY
ncbi:uncharacterized protein [Maniola hyperantus]|uniref:uncharacterized protein n=1 Tax=Aphantopus hyperantus TaxID=2795564 RepID=UPI00374A8FEF